MRLLAFDGRMGASGDMLLGALVAAGADPSVLSPVEDALDVTYRVHEVDKNGILATKVDVLLAEADGGDPRGEGHGDDHRRLRADGDDGADSDDGGDGDDAEHSHQHQYHHHDHAHDEEQTHHDGDDSHGQSQGHDHSHPHSHDDHKHHHSHDDHAHAEGHGPHRIYPEVVDLVESMNLPPGVVADATAIFRVLGEAEAEVHGTNLDATHFHEVGADDAVADVVGVCLLLDDLGVDRVVTGPVAVGGGETEMSHGTYPVPAPAVVNITAAADWSVRGGPVEAELLTPTGAAILAHLAEGVETLPSMSVESSGYGAGGWEFPDHPNVLRAVVGDGGSRLVRDEITVLETNLDDAPPEVLGGLQATLKDAGARDVTIVPTTMKKSRPGHLVKVVVKPEDAERVAYRLAVETGTLGIREHGAGHRWTARREFETATLDIDGDDYEVSVKVASDADGVVYDRSAEYDDALAVANETGVPVREIMRRAVDAVASEAGGT
ncbi:MULTISPECIES: nickel pincer cofactor biosynthesis protein LarC [unclassified Haloferax]|uniref:Nickel pincer cofactor biosynthesis protein LarC n=1 Tax=Haloferax sp. Atlit-48N TaxID=2077198 RepID=A0ACD5HYU1_9EURY|nr:MULTISPECIES: nickel pincer cofactor biosynthesis protein LarC [unclassified Haloferax]RDZ31413.1 nickel pincer cofactor biosynthesis protein LarC [Haloferax sp. Atlit-48N]RDZ34997.1 nickel pincer cofactor biosynthesis protein LarC [Haloferax sp. Atlit-24N]RDZ38732.1 nickel pincer cofactor biosynthesis protein LarC [Haloferax sp. Atlit-47N]RLM35409.1 nickel pincer cofactor biosynthesis protein LarC [Haloferax sp. Atlit-109R]RLM43254.1 nickel pincer cofactor biosynthesis protein LarC [Halofe